MSQTTQLIGLCDEIASLARLNLPLENTLLLRSHLLSGMLRHRVRRLAQNLEKGQSLVEAIKSDPSFPPVYVAVIEAGLASGRLAEPLEELARGMRTLRDNRRFLIRVTLYPMIVVSFFWLLFSAFCVRLCLSFYHMFQDTEASWPLMPLFGVTEEHPAYFTTGILVGLAILWFLYAAWCFHASRSTLLRLRTPWGLFGIGRANRDMAQAAFARLTAMMLRTEIPLPRALTLALRAVGDRNVTPTTEAELERLLHDPSLIASNSDDMPTVLRRSPVAGLIRWMMRMGNRSLLLSGLEQFAELNDLRARRRLERLEYRLPALLTFSLGALLLLAYLGTVFLPYIYLLYHVSTQIG